MFDRVSPRRLWDTPSPDACHYLAVGPDSLGGQFPRPLGVSTYWSPSTVDLRVVTDENNVTLELTSDEHDRDAHDAIGIAEGYHQIGMAVKRGTTWTGEVARLLGGRAEEWQTPEPDSGVFDFHIYIDADVAAGVEAAEMEHVDDFAAAWSYSVDSLRWAVDEVTPQPTQTDALNQLIAVLVANDLTYLVPATPADLGAWGTRARKVYQTLCDHSKKRDYRGEHNAAGCYLSTLPAGEEGRTRPWLVLQYRLGEAHPGSDDYVVPAEVPGVHNGEPIDANAVDTTASSVTFNPGDKVTWLDETPPIEMGDPEQEYYLAATKADGITDTPAVIDAVLDGATVHGPADSNDQVWLTVSINGSTSYVLARKKLLTPQ